MNDQLALQGTRPAPPLTFPTDKATTEFFAQNWRERGVEVSIEKRGYHWVVVEVPK